MAQTLPNGTIVPNADGGEPISATGVAEMRTLGASVDTALSDKASQVQLALKADKSVVDAMADKVFYRGAIPSGSDLDTWLTDSYNGLWRTTAGVSPTLTGAPEQHKGQPFQLLHMGSSARVATQMLIPYGFYSTTMLTRSIDNISTNTWTDWAPVGGGSVDGSGEAPWTPNHIRKAMFMQAMGGPIDTGGKAAVALRFDHGLANFQSKVLPAVKARGMKVSMAYNPRRWDLAENAGVTASMLNGWVAAGDVEIWNHSATHTPADDEATLYDQIVNGLAEIEAELPAAAGQVWGFNPPGVSSGNYMGFDDGRTPTGWDTYAGRLILQHHAVASGYLSGTQIRPLDGTIRDGQVHFTIDGLTVATIKGHVDSAIAQGGGLQLMLHPSQLDTAGKLTTAQFTEVLDYIVAKRTAGDLVTLSPYQMLVADATNTAPSWGDVTGKPSTFAPSAHTHAIANTTGLQAALDAKARKEPVDLGEQNLDDVIDEGPYVQTSSATATAVRNYPANGNGLYTAGFLDVVSRPGDYLVKQYFTAFNGLDTMWRTRYAGTWNQWRRTFRADEATPVINRVAALEYNTGWRDVTSLLGTQYISGEYWIKRVRNTVYLHFYELKLVAGAGSSVRPSWALITGFRPSTRYANMPFAGKNATQYAAGPLRVSRYGVTDIYGYAADLMIDADVSFDTEDAPLAPAALPGTAATIF